MGVREVLESHSKELRIVFQIYATADVSSGLAMQRVSTMNIKEFNMLLHNCELLDETLTESAVLQIFEGIQQSADSDTESEAEKSEELDDDEAEGEGLNK